MPSGIIPVPVGVSVAIRSLSNALFATARFTHRTAVRILPAWQICSAMSLSLMTRSKSSSGIAIGPPFMWYETFGRMASRCSPMIELAREIDAPPV